MRKTRTLMLMMAAIFLVFCCLAVQESGAQTGKTPTVKKMTLTGKIAKARHGYIIQSRRDKGPGEVFTILNPEPKVLDELVKSKKTVSIEVRAVSGDNVNIEKIDGKQYGQGAQ